MYKEFEKLCAEKNISVYQISKETGIAQSTLSDWKRGISTPKVDKLMILSDYFGVPLETFIKKD